MSIPKCRSRLVPLLALPIVAALAFSILSAAPAPVGAGRSTPKHRKRLAMPFRGGSPFVVSIEGVPAGVKGLSATYTHSWPGGGTTSIAWPVHLPADGGKGWTQSGSVLTAAFDPSMPKAPSPPGGDRKAPRATPGTGVLVITTDPPSDTEPGIDVEPIEGVGSCP